MHFADPQYLYLFLIIPIYYIWEYYDKKKKRGVEISVFADLLKANGKSKYYFWNYLRQSLFALFVILSIIALARPQGAHEKQDVSKKGIDIIIAVDVSGSMMAEDLKPNRIEAAKAALKQFVDKLKDDRLGIVVFAGQAFTQSPLTFDYNILEEYINNISTNSINQNVNGMSGTAIGDAILSAVNRFKDSKDRSKVLVVITDGDANTGADPQIAAKKAASEGIKIYTVGVGKPGGAPLPMTDAFGNKTIARNRDGSPVMATFNEEALKQIAETGKGQYYRAGDNESFNEVMDEINKLQKRDISMSTTVEYSEGFYPYLLSAFIAFVIYLALLALKTEAD